MVMYKIFIRFRKNPHATPTVADMWNKHRRRFNLHSPATAAVNSVFIYGVPLCVLVFNEGIIAERMYEKFFMDPSYIISSLTIVALLFLIGAILAAYRGDKWYATFCAFYCSVFITTLFVALAVNYRFMILVPESEMA